MPQILQWSSVDCRDSFFQNTIELALDHCYQTFKDCFLIWSLKIYNQINVDSVFWSVWFIFWGMKKERKVTGKSHAFKCLCTEYNYPEHSKSYIFLYIYCKSRGTWDRHHYRDPQNNGYTSYSPLKCLDFIFRH